MQSPHWVCLFVVFFGGEGGGGWIFDFKPFGPLKQFFLGKGENQNQCLSKTLNCTYLASKLALAYSDLDQKVECLKSSIR